MAVENHDKGGSPGQPAPPKKKLVLMPILTGYLGGATATHLRIGEPYFATVIVGMVLWGGLYLRDPRIRALLPLRS